MFLLTATYVHNAINNYINTLLEFPKYNYHKKSYVFVDTNSMMSSFLHNLILLTQLKSKIKGLWFIIQDFMKQLEM